MTWQIPWPEFLKKRLCRYLLQHYLGHFFKEKISLEQLSIDIYNGTGCVKDLHLDCEALNEQLNSSASCGTGLSPLPFKIVSGFVGYISVSVPWHDLFNDFCKLVVKNVQITIRTKSRGGYGAQADCELFDEPDLSTSDHSDLSNSMFSSVIIDSIMNTSMHIAQECLGEAKLDEESKAPLLGLEAFASTIDSILSRIQITVEQIQIRIEDVEKPADSMKSSSVFQQDLSSNGIAVELRIKSIKYYDLDSAAGHSDSMHTRNNSKNFCVEGLTVYFDEFIVRDDEPYEPSKSETSLNSTTGSNSTLNEEAPVDECPPFNFDLDPNYYLYTSPIIMVTFSGVQSIKLTVNNMRPTDLILDGNSTGNQVASQQRPFLEVSAQFGAIKCFLCPRQIHLFVDMADRLVDYVNSVEEMKRQFRLSMMKKKSKASKPVRGQTNKTNNVSASMVDSDHFTSMFQASDSTESSMFYSMMMPESKPKETKANKQFTIDDDRQDQNFTLNLKETIEQLQNDPIKLTTNYNLFQTFKVTLRQISVTLLHNDPPPIDKNSRLIVQRMKHVADFYFDWSSTIEIQSQTRADCYKYHQAGAFNDHFLLILKPVTFSLTQKINQRNKQYSLNDLTMSVGSAQLNEYLNREKVTGGSCKATMAIQLSRSAHISELVSFADSNVEQACIRAQLTVYEPSEIGPDDPNELLNRSFENITLSINQSLSVEFDISIMDRLFYILNDTSKTSKNDHQLTNKTAESIKIRNFEIKCEQLVKVGVRFPIADLSRLHQNKIVNGCDSAKKDLKMSNMIDFRNLRDQILTLHLFDLGFQTLQNRKANESDLVMSIVASQLNAYYQFKKEDKPIHFGLIQQQIGQARSLLVQITIPFQVKSNQSVLIKDDIDSLQYEHNINVSKAISENESESQDESRYEAKYGPFSSTYTVISSEKNRRIVNAGTKSEMNAFMHHSQQNSHITINMHIPDLKFLISDQYFLNDIYNCFLNDLLMYVPSVLPPLESSMYEFDAVNQCFIAPSLAKLIEADMDSHFFMSNAINLQANFDSDIDMDERNFHMCKSAILKSNSDNDEKEECDSDNANTQSSRKFTKRSFSAKKPKNLVCVCINIDNCHLKCMVLGEKLAAGIKYGEFDVQAFNFQMCLTSSESLKGDEEKHRIEKQLISIYTDKIQLGHSNKVSNLKLPSNYASFDALFQTSKTNVLISQNDVNVMQTLFNSTLDLPNVSIAIKSKYKPHMNKKELVVALNFNNLCLNHVFTEQADFWIFQLIDLFNLSDIAVMGYQVPLVVTELHLNVANSSVLYKPVNLSARAFIGFKSLHWSSNVTPESTSTLLVFNIEDIYLFLSRVSTTDNACDLKKDFVCVANTDLFELRILINETNESKSLMDIKIRSNMIQFRTCVDSAFGLIELINYIVSDGDLRGEPLDECENATLTLTSEEQSLTCPSLTCGDSTSDNDNVISDMVKEAMDPMTMSFHESRGDNVFELDEPFRPVAQRKLYFKKRDEECEFYADEHDQHDDDDDDQDEDKDLVKDFDIIDVMPGLGEPPRSNQEYEIKSLTSSDYEIKEDHFKKPLTKIDVLKAPENFPCPINVFSIQEISLNWFLYAGSDFEADVETARSRHNSASSTVSTSTSPQSVKSTTSSPSVKCTPTSVHFSKAGGRIIKKYENLTWITRGGQNRNLDVCMEIALHKVKTKCDIYDDMTKCEDQDTPDYPYLYRIALAIGDVVIRDRLSISSYNKFLFRYESEAYPNNANSNMIFFKFLCSRSLDEQRLLECDIKLSVQPLRFAIDQDALVFMIDFFNQLASKDLNEFNKKLATLETPNSSLPPSETPVQPTQQIFIRNFILAPDLFIKFDFSGKYDKRSDTKMDTLTKLLMVVVQLSNTEIKLKRVYYRRGFLGVDKLLQALVKEWISDIQRNQIKNLIKGWGIFNSLIQFFEGFTYLVLCPIEQYKRDGRVLFGIRKGSAAFSTCTVLATIELTNRMFQATKNIAEFFYDLVTPHRNMNMIGYDGSGIVDTLFTGVGPNRYVRIRRQPNDIREGLANAYYVLYEGFSDTAANFMSEISHGAEHKGLPGAIGGALRQLPPTALAPIVLTAEATCNILSGIRKQLKPDEKKDDDQKWKTITFN
uniref:Autophagy-related protein 2 n=1 Tax=Brachionus koreanus TaxID=1199090 RepID=A0A2Z4EUN6_9BILA|nr:autophagy-related protein 2 [Brachionus koreanus]